MSDGTPHWNISREDDDRFEQRGILAICTPYLASVRINNFRAMDSGRHWSKSSVCRKRSIVNTPYWPQLPVWVDWHDCSKNRKLVSRQSFRGIKWTLKAPIAPAPAPGMRASGVAGRSTIQVSSFNPGDGQSLGLSSERLDSTICSSHCCHWYCRAASNFKAFLDADLRHRTCFRTSYCANVNTVCCQRRVVLLSNPSATLHEGGWCHRRHYIPIRENW